MAKKIKSFFVENFTGGYNSFVSKNQVRDNESPDMMNMDFVGYGAIKRRNGYTKFTSEVDSGDEIRGVFSYYDGSTYEVLYIAKTKLYKDASPTEVTGGTFTDDKNAQAAQVGNRLYIANGEDSLQYYNGTGLTTSGISSAPGKPNYVVFYNNRLYTNDEEHPDRVYYSGAFSGNTSTGAVNTGNFSEGTPAYGGYLSFGQGKVVTGMTKFGSDYLYIFTQDSIHRITPVSGSGDDEALDHSEELVTNSYGCASHRSIEQVENDIFFLGYDGMYSLGEQPNFTEIRTKTISARVNSLLDSIPSQYKQNASGIYFNDKYYLAFTEGTYNDHVLVYDTKYQSWLYWDSINANSWCVVRDTNDAQHLYFGSDYGANSFVYEAEQGGNDDGVAIDWYYYTKNYDLKDFSWQKQFIDGAIQFGPVYGKLTLDTIIDETEVQRILTVGTSSGYSDGVGTSPMATFAMGTEGNTPTGTTNDTPTNDFRYYDIDTEGNTIQFKVAGSILDESAQIEKIKTNYWFYPSHYVRDSSKFIS